MKNEIQIYVKKLISKDPKRYRIMELEKAHNEYINYILEKKSRDDYDIKTFGWWIKSEIEKVKQLNEKERRKLGKELEIIK